MNKPFVFIDLSSLVYPRWHMSAKKPDPSWTSIQAIAKCREIANGNPRVAICVDSKASKRKDLDPTYKANRPVTEEPLRHQLRLCEEQLRADGFPVWKSDGFEADDVIATATKKALEHDDATVLIASSDKDLLQLVSERVQVQSLATGIVFDETGVALKFGVPPTLMRDYLTLVGDASDNIKGVQGIGPKKAVALLTQFGSLDRLLEKVISGQKFTKDEMQPMVYAALVQSSDLIARARELITLRTDAPFNFAEIFADRRPVVAEDTMQETLLTGEHVDTATGEVVDAPHAEPPKAAEPTPAAKGELVRMNGNGNGHAPWERQLEPSSLEDTRTIAKWLFTSRLFSQYVLPEAVFAVILAGRELGLGVMASLRGFHIVEGKPTMAADLIRALVLKSGKAQYFDCVERTNDKATWVTRRQGSPHESTVTYTMDDAKSAELVRPNFGWTKHPADMLAKTASAKLSRLVYSDVVFGLYGAEELGGEE